jgi:hypothetical protein
MIGHDYVTYVSVFLHLIYQAINTDFTKITRTTLVLLTVDAQTVPNHGVTSENMGLSTIKLLL